MKQKKNIIIISLFSFIGLLVVMFYVFPIFLDINPFYTKEIYKFEDGEIYRKEYQKYSLIPTIKASIPKGWSVKTTVFEEILYLATEIPESERVIGNASFEIYKNDILIASLSFVTDTGGLGITYYKFPDFDPKLYAEYLEYKKEDDSYISIIEIQEGEYSKFELFGLEVRRVGDVYLPNANEKETYYFTNSRHPILFYFGEEGPQYDVYHSGNFCEGCNVKYSLGVNRNINPSEEDLEIVDAILDSMELR